MNLAGAIEMSAAAHKLPVRKTGMEQETRTYQFTASTEFLNRIENMLAQIQGMGDIGHSGTVGFDVDGDGSDRLKVSPKLKMRGKIKTHGTYPQQYEKVG